MTLDYTTRRLFTQFETLPQILPGLVTQTSSIVFPILNKPIRSNRSFCPADELPNSRETLITTLLPTPWRIRLGKPSSRVRRTTLILLGHSMELTTFLCNQQMLAGSGTLPHQRSRSSRTGEVSLAFLSLTYTCQHHRLLPLLASSTPPTPPPHSVEPLFPPPTLFISVTVLPPFLATSTTTIPTH